MTRPSLRSFRSASAPFGVAARTTAPGLAALLVALAVGGAHAQTTLTASDGAAGDSFGGGAASASFAGGPGLATSGDTLVVGAFLDDVGGLVDAGSATVFARTGASWTEQQQLLPVAPAAEAWFGAAVDLDGDVIVVGAPHDDEAGFVQAGSATVYRYDGAGWVAEQRLVASAPAGFDWFGTSVALCGDTLAVGAPLGGFGGQVHVFGFDGASWVEQQVLTRADADVADFFGGSLALCGGVLVGGTVLDDVGADVVRGSATVFRFDGASWVEEQTLLAAAGATGDLFGAALDVRGDVIAVGAVGADGPGGADEGAVTVFRHDGAAWLEQQTLRRAAGAAGDRFGAAVSLSGARVLVGALAADVSGALDAGAAVVFRDDAGAWVEESTLLAADASAGDLAGSAVALCGGLGLVGAPGDDVGASLAQGSASLHDLGLGGAWTDEGFALPGVSGPPLLVGSGDLCPGSDNALVLTDAAPAATAGLFLGPASDPVPFKGGWLVPNPFLPPLILTTDPGGALPIPFLMPAGLPPGTELWAQWAIQDAAAVYGVALSNAVRGVTP